jgi:hypothetical protein
MDMTNILRVASAGLALSVSACMALGRGGSADTDVMPTPALLRAPNPLLGITQSYDQHMVIDSIRTMYRAELKALGKVTRQNHDDVDNVLQREIFDLRGVLTPEQQVIFDRHVAAALRPPAPVTDLDH